MKDKIAIDGGHDNFRVTIPDAYWLYRYAGEAMRVVAVDERVVGNDEFPGWCCDLAEAMLAELKRRSEAPPVSTEAQRSPGGAVVLVGGGPVQVTVWHDGKRATLCLRVKGDRLHVDTYEHDAPRLLGHTPLEEPA